MKKTKAWNHSMTCLISGYRQVTIRTTSTEWSTPNEREPSVCLSSCVEYWRYSKWENKSQKLSISIQYLNDMFYIKLSERKRRLVVLRKSLVFFGGCRPVASASRCVSVVFGVSVSCVRFWGSTWYSVGVPLLAAGMNTCSCMFSCAIIIRLSPVKWRKMSSLTLNDDNRFMI